MTEGGVGDSEPVWSSDGQYIYFSSHRENTWALWRVRADGGLPQRLTVGTGPESHPSVARNGTRLAYTTQTEAENIVILDRTTGEESRLPGLHEDYLPTISPDGGLVAFVSTRWEGKGDIWLQRLEDGNPAGKPERLTDQPGNASHPAFSPDGRWLAYYRIIGETRDIWTVPVQGGKPQQFTDNPAADIHPAWSSDGTRLAFASDRSGNTAIWSAPVVDGRRVGTPQQLSPPDLPGMFPSWSSGGAEIAFVGNRERRNDVWLVPADGSQQARRFSSIGTVHRLHWNWQDDTIWVCAIWDGEYPSLRRITPAGGEEQALDPPVVFTSPHNYGLFDMSFSGRLVVFSRMRMEGNIWVLETGEGVF